MISPEQRERIGNQFDRFCKVILINECNTYYSAAKRKSKHEISLKYLTANKSLQLYTIDKYFKKKYIHTVFVF